MAEEPCGKNTVHSSVEDAIHHADEVHGGGFTLPWWGQKNTANLVNVGLVIGRKKSEHAGWRLDYDPIKGLHLNYEDTSVSPKISIYHKISPVSVGVPNPEAIMVEYWLSWTKRHREELPRDVLSVFNREYGSTVVSKGGSDGQRTRLTMTKSALFGLGPIPS